MPLKGRNVGITGALLIRRTCIKAGFYNGGRKRIGGRPGSFIRSIPAHFKTATTTASVTSAGLLSIALSGRTWRRRHLVVANIYVAHGGLWLRHRNYIDVDPLFGTLADLDSLIDAAHRNQLKLILDFVPNHTSDQHPWFVESKSSRNNPKREWYIWRDPARDGAPPNNWLSEFGGSAWEFDPNTNQYYYHTFLAAQPDLNWRNPDVRNAMHDVMRFWLRRGVDGFRVDAVWYLIKDDQFRDNPFNPDFRPGGLPRDALIPLYTADLPEVHDAIRGMRRVLDEFPDRVLLGEIYLPIDRLVAYYGRDLDGVHFPYNFALLTAKWEARSIARLIDEYEAALPPGGWPNWVLGNHDRPRLATRIGPDQARVAAMLLLTLRGTPTLYYGDEIGMQQAVIPPDQVRDPFEKNVPGIGIGRDGCRTPMQWDARSLPVFRTLTLVAGGRQLRDENVESSARIKVALLAISSADRFPAQTCCSRRGIVHAPDGQRRSLAILS